MSTRAEQVEACKLVSEGDAFIHWDNDVRGNVASAATTLTRDGELRERLAAYADELATSGDPEEAETKRAIGAALKALLKETGDGV